MRRNLLNMLLPSAPCVCLALLCLGTAPAVAHEASEPGACGGSPAAAGLPEDVVVLRGAQVGGACPEPSSDEAGEPRPFLPPASTAPKAEAQRQVTVVVHGGGTQAVPVWGLSRGVVKGSHRRGHYKKYHHGVGPRLVRPGLHRGGHAPKPGRGRRH